MNGNLSSYSHTHTHPNHRVFAQVLSSSWKTYFRADHSSFRSQLHCHFPAHVRGEGLHEYSPYLVALITGAIWNFMFLCVIIWLTPLSSASLQSCPTLCSPYTAAHQAPPSLGFSRQEHWSGLPFHSPMHESEKWKWSRPVVSDSSLPHGLRLPGSSTHGIFQARVPLHG